MAKKNTPKNLRVVNSEQKGRPSWGIRFVLQRLVTAKSFAAFLGCYGANPNAALDSNTPEDLGLSAESDLQQGRVGLRLVETARLISSQACAGNQECNQQNANALHFALAAIT
jgi:hypothetical protein